MLNELSSQYSNLTDRLNNFLPTETIDNVPITELQNVIDSLPKLLNRNITINVLAGTYTGTLVISNNSGNGFIDIFGATTKGTTHTIDGGIQIFSNNNTYIRLRGFNIIGVLANNYSIHITNNVCRIMFLETICRKSGARSAGSLLSGNAHVDFSQCEFHNHDNAIYCSNSLCTINTLHVTDVANAIVSQINGRVHCAYTPTGTALSNIYVVMLGGYIVRTSGTLLGT